jgi:parallel beta-helix repeat protein
MGLGILSLFFLLLFISNIDVLHNRNVNTNETNMENELIEDLPIVKSSGYWNNFSYIHITGSNWSTAASYDWCSGNGSWSNPYIIENMTIDAASSPTGSGIYILSSQNDYFIIRNVTVYNAGTGFYDAGIYVGNSGKGTLTNNNCSNNGKYGINLYIYGGVSITIYRETPLTIMRKGYG